MTEVAQDRFNYVYSCDLDVEIQIKIGTLEGQRERPGYQELINDPLLRYSGACQEQCSDLYVTCRVYADGKSLSLPTRTSYKSFTNRWNWNEWVTLPVKYSDLPRDAQLALTIWDIYGPRQAIPVGGTTISLFGKKGMFRQGMFDLKIWPKVEADGQSPTTTPGKTSGKEDEMSRLARLSKKHRGGHMPKVDWLDRLTFREIHMINEKEKRGSNFLYLMIEFPQIHWDGQEFSVVYFEPRGDELYQYRTYADIVTVPDPEIGMENLVESKHHKLARSLRSGPSDKDLKPNAATRDQLNTIVGYPPSTTLTSEEQDLVWKFRFYLSSQKKALTKFLKSVNWNLPQETKQALDLLNKWSPMDIDDALELLSPAFTHPAVRKYAVQRLTQADDEELLLYLLQLVQALKYENFEEIKAAYEKEINQMKASVAHVTVEPERERTKSLTDSLVPGSERQIQDPLTCDTYDSSPPEEPPPLPEKEEEMDLATFLITRAVNNFKLANFLCWYLMVECDDQDSQTKDGHIREMYVSVLKRFSNSLNNGGIECRLRRASISGQQVFMEKLYKVVKIISRESGNRKKKIEKLQALLSDPDVLKFNFLNFDPIPLPLDPDVKVKGIVADQAHLFASALMPCRFNFRCTDDQEYVTIFKYGDDLRQDQLILQIITLMDMLLRKENLDLKLTPYKVLATNCKNGFVQFIQATSVAEILDSHGTIHNFFRKYAPSENGAYGIAPEVIDNYIKSCAGYCVITYLLGVGDRHFDNLLLSKTGKLFHVDFGYILGRDPKPLPPPMKLSKEMVDAMGGTNSEHFTYFKKMCYTAFLALRRSANLILNLFSLMVDANVPDIALEPDKTVKKVQDKFRLDLSDEEAVHFMQNVIDVSVSATMAAILEQMHKFAQYLRK